MKDKQQIEWILGIDGGGTKTTAWLASHDREQEPLGSAIQCEGRGESGPANPRSVGMEKALENLQRAIACSFQDARRVRVPVDSICICMAGLGRKEEREPIARWARDHKIARRICISEDITPIRWAARFEREQSCKTSHGVAQQDVRDLNREALAWRHTVTLISGTGSIASANDAADGDWSHQDLRVGGWGYLLGDEGSGFSMGLSGLKEVCRAHDHGEEMTPFHRAMMEAMGCAAPLELIPRVYMLPIPRPEIAALNRIVMEHTEDPVARRILVQAAEDLACLVVNAVNRRGFAQGRYALALSGGNLGPHSPLIPAFLERLREWNREPMLHHHVQNPVIGALVMAAKNPVVGSSVL